MTIATLLSLLWRLIAWWRKNVPADVVDVVAPDPDPKPVDASQWHEEWEHAPFPAVDPDDSTVALECLKAEDPEPGTLDQKLRAMELRIMKSAIEDRREIIKTVLGDVHFYTNVLIRYIGIMACLIIGTIAMFAFLTHLD